MAGYGSRQAGGLSLQAGGLSLQAGGLSLQAEGLSPPAHAPSEFGQHGHRPLDPGAGRPGTRHSHPNTGSNASMFIGSHHTDDPAARLPGGLSTQFAAGFAPFDTHNGQTGAIAPGALPPPSCLSTYHSMTISHTSREHCHRCSDAILLP